MSMTQAIPLRATPAHTRPARLLVVGGPDLERCRVASQLRPRGYEVERAAELDPALAFDPFDVAIFALPVGESDAVVAACATLHTIPGPALLVLHGAADPSYAVRVLEAGADDCLLAPHNPREIEARVRALLRRRRRNGARYGGRHLIFDGIRVDAGRRRLEGVDGRVVELTQGQYRLLAALLARPREVVSREYLLAEVLGLETDAFDRAIDVHVSRLKKRLAQVSTVDLITCYRGVGYRIEVSQVTH